MRRKKEIELLIDKNIFPNLGEGTYEGKRIRLKGAFKGQKVSCILGREKEDFREAKLTRLLERSSLEDNEPCLCHENCGGCFYQTISLETEEAFKREMIEELFYGKIDKEKIEFRKNPKPFAYRNKMEYTFGDSVKGGPLVLGLHRRGRFYEIIDTKSCNLVHPDFEEIRSFLMNYFREIGKKHYVKNSHEGFLRHLIIRYAHTSGQIMVNLVTSSQDELDKLDFIEKLLNLKLEGKITSIIHTINDDQGDAVKPEEIRLLYGKDYIEEELLGLKFRISAFSFFQPNVFGIEKLYSYLGQVAGDLSGRTVYDLYSGTGTIGQIAAQKAKKVISVEIIKEAVEKAKENAKLNGIENIDFRANDLLDELDKLKEAPDLVILDPPRSGIHPKVLKGIIARAPKNFIYVSCNPKSLAGDVDAFLEAGYQLKSLVIFDQFTRTYHVESVVLMERK